MEAREHRFVTSTTKLEEGVTLSNPSLGWGGDGNPLILIEGLRGFARRAKDEQELKHDIGVAMTEGAYRKMFGFVAAAPGEVSGFGRVVRKGNLFVVEDVFILEQHNTEASTLIDVEKLGRIMRKLHKRGLDTEGWDCWWHSHSNFACFWSGTDLQTIEVLKSSRHTVSIVANKALQTRARVDFYQPQRHGVDGIPIQVIPEFPQEQMDEIRGQMAAFSRRGR